MIRSTIHRTPIACAVLLLAAGTAIAAWGPAQNIIPAANAYGASWTASNGARGLAVSADTVFLVWADGIKVLANTGNQVMFKYYSGASWGGDTVIGYLGNFRLHNWFPSCARDASGRLHFVWESSEYELGDGYDLSYTSCYQGVWSGQQHLVATPSNTWHPVIAATADGKVYLCWQDDRGGGFQLFYKVLDGGTWSGDLAVPDPGSYASFPSMAPNGNAVAVAWQDFREGVFQVHLRELDGSGWGPDSALSHSALGAFAPCVAADAGGNYHVVWEDWRDDNAEIYYRCYDRTAHSWGPETRISDNPWHSRAPVLVCRGDSLADVFWEDDRSGYYQIMSRTALRGSWGPETTLTAGWADNRCPNVCADARGNRYLVWSGFGVYPPTRPDLFSMSDMIDPWPKSSPGTSPAASLAPFAVRAFPNPASTRATVMFDPAGERDVPAEVRVYSITGQLLRTIPVGPARGSVRSAGWDGTDDHGRNVASGVYLITARQGGRSGTAKLTLVR